MQHWKSDMNSLCLSVLHSVLRWWFKMPEIASCLTLYFALLFICSFMQSIPKIARNALVGKILQNLMGSIKNAALIPIIFMQPIDMDLIKLLIPVSICHALGHVMTNVSFAAVAVSFTHTVKGMWLLSRVACNYVWWDQKLHVLTGYQCHVHPVTFGFT